MRGRGPVLRSSERHSAIRRARSEGGFTLVEVLLALSILLAVLTVILSTFMGAETTREILSHRESSFRETRLLLDRLGTDVSGGFVSPQHAMSVFTCKEDQFSGKSASTVSFSAFALPDASDVRPSGGIVRIRYSPRLSADGRFLEIYREQSDIPFIENKVPNRETRVAGRLRGFRVELHDGQKWVKEWPPDELRKRTMPRMAAFVVTDAEGTEFRRVVPVPLAGREIAMLYSGKRLPLK